MATPQWRAVAAAGGAAPAACRAGPAAAGAAAAAAAAASLPCQPVAAAAQDALGLNPEPQGLRPRASGSLAAVVPCRRPPQALLPPHRPLRRPRLRPLPCGLAARAPARLRVGGRACCLFTSPVHTPSQQDRQTKTTQNRHTKRHPYSKTTAAGLLSTYCDEDWKSTCPAVSPSGLLPGPPWPPGWLCCCSCCCMRSLGCSGGEPSMPTESERRDTSESRRSACTTPKLACTH